MDDLYSVIDRYLTSERRTPIIVDIPDAIMMEEAFHHYHVPGNIIVRSSKYCQENETPQIDKMQYELMKSTEPTFLFDWSSHLRLCGEKILRKELRRILDMKIESKLVIFTFQCKEFLNFGDPRLTASSRIVFKKGSLSNLPKVIFVKDRQKQKKTFQIP